MAISLSLYFPLIPLLFTFVLIIFTWLINTRKKNLPPSPWKLPLIGHMHHLFGAPPHRAFRKLSQRYGSILYLKLGMVDHIVISSAEAAKEILKTHDINFASRPHLVAPTLVMYGNRDIAFSPYGAYWRQLRKICVLELLSARRVKAFRHIREDVNTALVTSISLMPRGKASHVINLTEKFLLLSNTTTARAAFGSECKHGSRFIAELKKGIKLASGFNIADLYPSISTFLGRITGMRGKLQMVHRQIDEILEEIVSEHLATTKSSDTKDVQEEEDLVDVLLRLKEQGGLDLPLSLIDVKSVTLDMFIGGTETSSTTLIWVMAELMRHPAVMDRLQDEVRQAAKAKDRVDEEDMEKLQYMKLVIKETLRLHPPIPLLLPRICGETCNVGGFNIPTGSRILINAWAIATDPSYWDDPESFKPERFEGSTMDFRGESFQYLPFGGGRRICPGIAFGLAGVELALAQLLFHFDWELPDKMQPEDLDMTESFGSTMTKKLDLCLIAAPHFPFPLPA